MIRLSSSEISSPCALGNEPVPGLGHTAGTSKALSDAARLAERLPSSNESRRLEPGLSFGLRTSWRAWPVPPAGSGLLGRLRLDRRLGLDASASGTAWRGGAVGVGVAAAGCGRARQLDRDHGALGQRSEVRVDRTGDLLRGDLGRRVRARRERACLHVADVDHDIGRPERVRRIAADRARACRCSRRSATALALLKLSMETLIEPSTMNSVAFGSPFGPGPWSVSWWTDRWAAGQELEDPVGVDRAHDVEVRGGRGGRGTRAAARRRGRRRCRTARRRLRRGALRRGSRGRFPFDG